ncbi:hypothetical protein E2C01_096343 [Portunus trituberculatus]|uniref:Uncharacterized protein n=1 Tax=Portunus trituberculatus TaxID=210409 RepID=A0A5B7JSD5_PORTR|nr:hypothetical protein [Portunus trituberculatus]
MPPPHPPPPPATPPPPPPTPRCLTNPLHVRQADLTPPSSFVRESVSFVRRASPRSRGVIESKQCTVVPPSLMAYFDGRPEVMV